MLHKELCHVYIGLLSTGHKNAYYPVSTESLGTESRNYRAVLSSRYADYGITALSVFLKETSYPIYTLVFYLLSIKHLSTLQFIQMYIQYSYIIAHLHSFCKSRQGKPSKAKRSLKQAPLFFI